MMSTNVLNNTLTPLISPFDFTSANRDVITLPATVHGECFFDGSLPTEFELVRFVDVIRGSTSRLTKELQSHPENAGIVRGKADQLYKKHIERLKGYQDSPAITQMQKAIFQGEVIKLWRDFDNAYSQVKGHPQHRYCGCHVVEAGTDPAHPETQLKEQVASPNRKFYTPNPQASEIIRDDRLKGKSMVGFTWSLGESHNSGLIETGRNAANREMHYYPVEADEVVLKKTDFVSKLTYGLYSQFDVVNSLMRNNCWKTLEWISWAFSGKESPSARAEKVENFAQEILRVNADVSVSTFSRHAGAIEEAARTNGRPAVNRAIDFETALFDIENPDDVGPHFRQMVLTDKDPILMEDINGVLSPNQIVAGGLPIRKQFSKQYSAEELAQIREKWGIAPDARVVVLVSGGAGVRNDYAERIVNEYKGDKPLHMFVLVGKNEAEGTRLTEQFKDNPNPKIKVNVRGWTNVDQLGEIYATTAEPGKQGVIVSAKGGGAAVGEPAVRGTFVLVRDANPLSWEKKTIDHVVRNNLSDRFESEDLTEKLTAALDAPYEPAIDYRTQNAEAMAMEAFGEVIAAAENDPTYQERR